MGTCQCSVSTSSTKCSVSTACSKCSLSTSSTKCFVSTTCSKCFVSTTCSKCSVSATCSIQCAVSSILRIVPTAPESKIEIEISCASTFPRDALSAGLDE